ncbi:TetR/AcrR family transcriptional regulator [Actinomycetospora chiangmaiensis]|uniref:TetR/AcrR family transcriptional regulator n=1 Tax=Actinomycetospora chiangmaiensis TaxID=402650 RepID=UPI00036806BF|nr:TetR/AcrR family transcriptional regulator [Actinomycetospora chiangmaiensis]
MPRLTTETWNRRRRHVLESAWSCFSRDGFHATSMDQVIEASGMSANAVYRYFASKDELIDATVDEALAAAEAVFATLLDDDPLPGPDRLVEQLVATVQARRGEPYDLSRLAMQAWTEALRRDHLRARVAAYYRAVARHVEDLVRRWIDAGLVAPGTSPGAVARLVITLMPGLVVTENLVEPTVVGDLLAGLTACAGATG